MRDLSHEKLLDFKNVTKIFDESSIIISKKEKDKLKALDLEKVALVAGRELVTESDLKNYLMSLGRSCKSCHKHYRK